MDGAREGAELQVLAAASSSNILPCTYPSVFVSRLCPVPAGTSALPGILSKAQGWQIPSELQSSADHRILEWFGLEGP